MAHLQRHPGCTGPRRRAGGFTAIELFVALLLVGILAAYFGQGVFGTTNDAKLRIAKTALTEGFPRALQNFYANHDPSTAITKADLESRGIKSTTPWGGSWSVDGSQKNDIAGVTINYTTGFNDATAKRNNTVAIAKMLATDGAFGQFKDAAGTATSSQIRPQWHSIKQARFQSSGVVSVTYLVTSLPTNRSN